MKVCPGCCLRILEKRQVSGRVSYNGGPLQDIKNEWWQCECGYISTKPKEKPFWVSYFSPSIRREVKWQYAKLEEARRVMRVLGVEKFKLGDFEYWLSSCLPVHEVSLDTCQGEKK